MQFLFYTLSAVLMIPEISPVVEMTGGSSHARGKPSFRKIVGVCIAAGFLLMLKRKSPDFLND